MKNEDKLPKDSKLEDLFDLQYSVISSLIDTDDKVEDDVILDGEGNNILSITFNYEDNFAKWIIGGHWQKSDKQQILSFANKLLEAANKMEE